MNKSESIGKISLALSKAQAEMPVVKMNAQNPFLKNKYADLGAVIETSRPVLAKHELAVTQFPVCDGDKIGVTTCLTHSSGEWIEDTIFINSTDSKGLSVAQSAGVVISYLRRYAWAAVLGMYADEDTDGHGNSEPTKSVKSPQSSDKGKVDQHKPNEVITDADWEGFERVRGQALSMNVKLPEYDRSKMTASTLNGAKQYILQQISKKEGK